MLELDDEDREALGFRAVKREEYEEGIRRSAGVMWLGGHGQRLEYCDGCQLPIMQDAKKPRRWCSRACMHKNRYVRRSPNALRAKRKALEQAKEKAAISHQGL